jgi:pentatricopeptide repeat protein
MAASRSPTRASAELADALLTRMELPVDEGGYDVEPDRLSYALTILACARCPDDLYAAERAQAILEKMEVRARWEERKRQEVSSAAPAVVSLDLECFNVVLTALSKSRNREAPVRAVNILRRMEQYYREGYEAIRPNVRSWNAVLHSFARATRPGRSNYPARAENILNHMFSLHQKGVPNVLPDAFSFAAVLLAHQKSFEIESVHRADKLVRRMEELFEAGEIEVPPDVYHYTILCGAWAKSKQRFAAERCIQILSHMMERDKAGYPDVKPNTRTYNAVLDCLARSSQHERAEQLLFHMLHLNRKGDKNARPDAFRCVYMVLRTES